MDTREIILSENWRFHYGDCPEAWYAGFDDSAWERVFVPHDFAVGAPFSEDYSSGTGYLRGGTAWYRLHFLLPEEYRGQSLRIDFDGVYKNSQVWCNSFYLGKRPSGYAPFSCDIAHCAKFGGEDNVLAVRVAHEDISDSRWYTGSGITRPVTLVVGEPVHPAHGGVFFSVKGIEHSAPGAAAPDIAEGAQEKGEDASAENGPQPLTAARASLRLCLELENDGGEAQTVRIAAWLDEAVGDGVKQEVHAAAFAGTDLTLSARGRARVELTGEMEQPRLWSPAHPQLYLLTVALSTRIGGGAVSAGASTESREISAGASAKSGEADAAGDAFDQPYRVATIPVGIREARFAPDRGFFLNGVPMKIKGVCVHEDAGCLGAAVPAEVWERRLELLKDCGCNAIRMSHNPHAEALYALCDRMGFLVMDEAFDEWENPKNKWWCGHNVYPPRHQGYYEDFPAWHDADLKAMVRRDRNHPSVILWSIGNEIDYPNDPYCHPMFETMTGNNDANKPAAERRYDPEKPNMERLAVIAGELAAIVRAEDDTREVTLAAAFPELSARIGFIDAVRVVGYNYKEQLYAEDHRRFPDKVFLGSENGHSAEAWKAVTDNDFICGQFLWTGIDYLGEAHGWPVHGSPAGLLTTAGFPKEGYYERKALWGKDGAAARPDADTAPVGGTDAGKAVFADFLVTRWRPRRADADAAAKAAWEERAQETGFVEQYLLTLVDADGCPVRDDDQWIAARVEGPGELIGLDNGDLADNTPFVETVRKTCRGELAIYVRRTGPGEIVLRTACARPGTVLHGI